MDFIPLLLVRLQQGKRKVVACRMVKPLCKSLATFLQIVPRHSYIEQFQKDVHHWCFKASANMLGTRKYIGEEYFTRSTFNKFWSILKTAWDDLFKEPPESSNYLFQLQAKSLTLWMTPIIREFLFILQNSCLDCASEKLRIMSMVLKSLIDQKLVSSHSKVI